jgi:hypothetical protein
VRRQPKVPPPRPRQTVHRSCTPRWAAHTLLTSCCLPSTSDVNAANCCRISATSGAGDGSGWDQGGNTHVHYRTTSCSHGHLKEQDTATTSGSKDCRRTTTYPQTQMCGHGQHWLPPEFPARSSPPGQHKHTSMHDPDVSTGRDPTQRRQRTHTGVRTHRLSAGPGCVPCPCAGGSRAAGRGPQRGTQVL